MNEAGPIETWIKHQARPGGDEDGRTYYFDRAARKGLGLVRWVPRLIAEE